MKFVAREPHEASLLELCRAGVHPVLARLWSARGIRSAQETELDLKHLLPPNTLLNCNRGASYLLKALREQKKLLIVADYDCDGATACAVGIRGLKELGAPLNVHVDYLVPNRFTMGYGLTPEVVEQAAGLAIRPDILITVDNGIASHSGIEYAHQLGMEVLVTDHHLPGDSLPPALIINPNQPECPFASKALAGVGVMFYLLIALRSLMREEGFFTKENQPRLEKLLDLVALGTVADVASLDRNNRIFVHHGIKRIREHQMQSGIKALYQVAGRDPSQATAFDLGFTLGPRLNAAGRLADMSLGIRCLLSDDPQESLALAQELDRMNRERRHIEADMQNDAWEDLQSIDATRNSICLMNESWHQGVIGIVASRIKERFYRPTIIFAPGEDQGQPILKGSGRSIVGFHLRDALDMVAKRHPHLILKFGGHAMAAGLSIPTHAWEDFQTAFEKVAQELLNEDLLARQLHHDGFLQDDEISPALADLLRQQVWGQGFAQPVFIGDFEVISQSLVQDKHLRVQVRSLTEPHAKVWGGIWFGRTQSLERESRLAYRLAYDEFGGTPRAQLHIEACEEVV